MLELRKINLQVGDFSLKNINFKVEKNDYFILLGVSGSGKSLILETIAGLQKPHSGSVILEGKDITAEKIQQRSIGIVFQDYAVFPHMTVYHNIAYSLYGKALNSQEKESRIRTTARQMNIESLLNRRPVSLSGGEMQRVALARTLVQEPKVLLLDEPLSSLDVQLRSDLSSLLRQLSRNGQTIIQVSHSYEEAVSLGNKIAVIHNGTVLQQGYVDDVLQNPVSEFVAHFTGIKNFYPVWKKTGDNDIYYLNETTGIRIRQECKEDHAFLMIKSEDIWLTNNATIDDQVISLPGQVMEVVKIPAGYEVMLNIGVPLFVKIQKGRSSHFHVIEGEKTWVNFKSDDVRLLPSCKNN